MDLNAILFPAPKSSYSADKILGELMWIPKNFTESNDEGQRQNTAPEMRSETPPLSYGTKLFKINKDVTVADTAFKLECKEPELDEISIITTASSKKPPLDGKQEQNAPNDIIFLGESLLEQEFNSTDRVIPFKPIQKNPLATFNEGENSDSDADTVTYIEEPMLKVVPDDYTKKPKTSNIEHADVKNALHIESALEHCKKTNGIITTSRKQIFSQLKQPLSDMQPANEKKQSKGLSSIKNMNVIKNNLAIKLDEMVKVNATKMLLRPKPSQGLSMRNNKQSLASFDPTRIDEHNDKTTLLCSPRTLLNYNKKNCLRPVNNKPMQKQAKNEDDENVRGEDEEDCKQIERETVYETAGGEFTNPVTTQKYRERCYVLNPKLSIPKSSGLVRSLVSPPPMKRFGMRMKFQNENISVDNKANVSLDEINLSARGISTSTKSTNNITKTGVTGSEHIPCMLLRSPVHSSKMMIYFHGNGEDVNLAFDLLMHARDNLRIHVVAVEYPGYGIYKGRPNESKILEDAECVYDYFVTKLKIDPRDLIIFGRSIGSGPASYLASKRNIGALVLMSGFTSIRSVVKDFAGSWATYLIKERFDNLKAIAEVTCPTFIVHGQSDKLIPFSHSKQLHDACRAQSELLLPKRMDHIEFDFFEDFSTPLLKFLERCGLRLGVAFSGRINFPKSLFEVPKK